MRAVATLALLGLVVTSCSGQAAHKASFSPSATGLPRASSSPHVASPPSAAAPSAGQGDSVVVATDGPLADGVALARIGPDRIAHDLGRLRPPPIGSAVAAQEVSLSAGDAPQACVLWSAQHVRALQCYSFGDGKGVTVAGADTSQSEMFGLSLSPDGSHLAWITQPHLTANGGEYDLVTAHYAGGVLTDRHDDVVFSDRGGECRYPFSASWLADDRVVMACSGANDASGGYAVQTLPVRAAAVPLRQRHRGRFNQYVELVAYSPTEALAVENQYCAITCADGKPRERSRAVRLDLRTGDVTKVVGFAAQGRTLVIVTGGSHGIIYTTAAQDPPYGQERAYLERPRDGVGTLIRGLTGSVLAAQP